MGSLIQLKNFQKENKELKKMFKNIASQMMEIKQDTVNLKKILL